MANLSILMATKNGANFIREQVESILKNNRNTHSIEIIVSDDNSSDSTIPILESCLQDIQYYIYKNQFNSPVLNFEFLIEKANNDIIFLSDQDDIWFPEKIYKIVKVFQENPQVTLVVTDAQMIDERGKVIGESFLKVRGGFKSGVINNIIKNYCPGCTLAFRKEMVKYLLPFPKDIYMHDVWIGIVNEIYGKTYYIDEPLILYRRHSKNVTSLKSSNKIMKMISWRYALVKNIFQLILKHGITK